ncbi:hypothetical protein ANN_10133 [Periplaneta americana]|uniref:Uncharacterized protein n=1 Tax=Periplaneta americana TaxID=6978 RepID=A0ABQ8TN79_PERAM|nr:hypothetical protein ANN_10133 [Periplaneta americana]
MTPPAENASLNSSFIDLIWYYMYEISNLVLGAFGLTSNIAVEGSWYTYILVDCYEGVINWLAFDDFQIKLLKGFLFIFFANIFLIYMSWKIYGKRISEKFMRPVTSKTIEDLKRSVSLLKLPKEHSPRV